MNGRRSIPRQNHIPTVSMIRKKHKERSEKQKNRDDKSNDCIDHLFLHLNILGSSSITVDRSRVAVRLSHYVQILRSRQFHTPNLISNKAINLIFDQLFRLMTLERDEYVLEKLLELISEMRGPLTWDIVETRAATEIQIPLKIIEENSSLRVRYFAWQITLEKLEKMQEIDHEICTRTVQIFLDLLSNFRANNCRITGKSLGRAKYYWEEGRFKEAEVIVILEIINEILSSMDRDDRTKLCRNENLMEIIFDALNERRMMHEMVLGEILHWSSDEDREYLIGRYEDELRMGLMNMDYRMLEECLNKPQIMALIIRNSSTLNKIVMRIKNEFECVRNDNECRWLFDRNADGRKVVLQLLRYGVTTNSSILQRILGTGVLCAVARYYASFPFQEDHEESMTFRDVLRAHPEWKESFRIATACDNPISYTALLGRSIPPRRSNPALYVIIDEEAEMI